MDMSRRGLTAVEEVGQQLMTVGDSGRGLSRVDHGYDSGRELTTVDDS